MFEIFYNSIIEEIFQRHAFRRDLLLKLLRSKRLVSDHVDVLEITLSDVQNEFVEPTKLFTVGHSVFLIAFSAITKHVTNYWKYIMPVFSFGYISIFTVKLFHRLKNKVLLERLNCLVSLIDQYELCIKQNLIFFNEANVMKFNVENSGLLTNKIEREREVLYIESIKSVSTKLVNLLTQMELSKHYQMPEKYETIYDSLDDLLNSDYFRNNFVQLTARDAKVFYNIFAITQSQYLLRVGMIAGYHPITWLILSDFKMLSKHLRSDANIFSNFFARLIKIDEQIVRNKYNGNRKIKSDLSVGLSTETDIANLKNLSLICSAKLIMLANECRNFDCEFQSSVGAKKEYNKESIMEIYERMNMLENNFNLCHTEYQRFVLTYNKYIHENYKLEIGMKKLAETETMADISDSPDDKLAKIVSEQTSNFVEDDFFAIDMMNEIHLNRTNSADMNFDDELLRINNRAFKTTFKPVLSQLKEIIEPINEKMKMKEKEILALKGIVLYDSSEISPNKTPNESESNSEPDDELDGDTVKMKKKKSMSYNKYNESREFLASKSTNLLPNLLSVQNTKNVLNEEVIE